MEEEYLAQEDSGSKVDLEEVLDPKTMQCPSDETSVPEPVQEYTHVQRRSGRVPRQPERYVGHISEGMSYNEDDDPKTYQEAIDSPQSENW